MKHEKAAAKLFKKLQKLLAAQAEPSYPLLRDAYAIIDGIPEERIELHSFISHGPADPTNCGTIACAAGWLAMHPKFNALGLTLEKDYPHMNGKFSSDWGRVLADLFGISSFAARSIFKERTHLDNEAGMSDKEVWKARVRLFLSTAVESK